MAMTLLQTAKLNAVDPMAWLTDALEPVVSGQTKTQDLHTLLPWNWKALQSTRTPKWPPDPIGHSAQFGRRHNHDACCPCSEQIIRRLLDARCRRRDAYGVGAGSDELPDSFLFDDQQLGAAEIADALAQASLPVGLGQAVDDVGQWCHGIGKRRARLQRNRCELGTQS
jgi:hypothetical protein